MTGSHVRYRFGIFEVDPATGELRRKGMRIKLHSQPFQLLLMLIERPGELLTREEICQELWPQGTFVDYEHGVNSAVNRLREALGDRAANPQFVETLARRGYRFVAPVEQVPLIAETTASEHLAPQSTLDTTSTPSTHRTGLLGRVLASPEDLPKDSHTTAQVLFVLLQAMYLGFYIGALANLAEIHDLLAALPFASQIFILIAVTAAILIPARAFLLCAVLFRAPGIRAKLLKLWPFLLAFDFLWALSPFLLLHHIAFGLALACITLLVYAPFAQRSLILMGAGEAPPRISTALQ